MSECKIMNDCLDSIANDYNFVKFCRIKSTEIDLSDKFVNYILLLPFYLKTMNIIA